MERIFKSIKAFFNFSNSETKGFVALLLLSVVCISFLLFPKTFHKDHYMTDPGDIQLLDSVKALFEKNVEPKAQHRKLYLFDPNLISLDSLLTLGFPENVARTLVKYRSKGGRFLIKSDLKKVYGLKDQLLERIYPYIDLPEQRPLQHITPTIPFDLNTITISQLQSTSKIPSEVAARVVNFRSSLGGFVNKLQLDEVYGLNGNAMDYLKSASFIAADFKPRLLKINQCSEKELAAHPYISRELAGDIIRFREINSIIKSEKVLANFKSMDKSKFKKLILYLDFD